MGPISQTQGSPNQLQLLTQLEGVAMAMRSGSGRELNQEWQVGAQHALYHHSGTWYHLLERFPGAFFDRHGYVLFPTEGDFVNCRELHIGKHVRVPNGISRIRGYTKASS